MRILNIVTVSVTCNFFRGSLAFMKDQGFETALCASPGEQLHKVADESGSLAFEVPMHRAITPFKDLVSLWNLYRVIRIYRPTIVNASTAKAGLLGMVAARMARVPVRVYLLRGLRLETTHGVKRFILGMMEWITSLCAHKVVCVSESLRSAYTDLGYASLDKALVLGAGSSNGVDAVRFTNDEETRTKAIELRERLGIPQDAQVIGFIGRLVRDKGIQDLVEAYKKIIETAPDTWLLTVGDFETEDPVDESCREWLVNHPQIKLSPFVADPKPYYAVIQVLAFPTYREGFPNVPLEAACMEVPVVGFRATGVVDAVQDGNTGALVALGDVEGLASSIRNYLQDPELRKAHGKAARERAINEFDREALWELWYRLYIQLLQEKGMKTPAPANTQS